MTASGTSYLHKCVMMMMMISIDCVGAGLLLPIALLMELWLVYQSSFSKSVQIRKHPVDESYEEEKIEREGTLHRVE